MVFKRLVLLFLIVTGLYSCRDASDNQGDLRDIPDAIGGANQLLIIIDTARWQGEVGVGLKEVLSTPYPGIINEEQFFKCSAVGLTNWRGLLKKKHNILIPVIKEERLNTKFYDLLTNNGDMAFIHNQFDVYAKGQQVTYVVANDLEEFELLLLNYKDDLLQNLNAQAMKVVVKPYFKQGEIEGVWSAESDLPFFIQIPKSFNLETKTQDFVWFRKVEQGLALNVTVYWTDIDHNIWASDTLQRVKDSYAKNFLLGTDDSLSYMMIEQAFPVQRDRVYCNDETVIRLRGLWRLNRIPMGGSFVSYHFYDKVKRRNYFVDGFVFAPGEQKSNYLRSLEAVLRTFRTNTQ